jgi:cytochrome c-type biogenesis protein CcsB
MKRLCLAILLALTAAVQVHGKGPAKFADVIDLRPLDGVAVWQDGRLKSYESFSRSMMQFVSGPGLIDGQSPGFTYLDLMLRPAAYENRAIYFVKKKPLRAIIINAAQSSASPPDRSSLEAFMESGLASRSLLDRPEVTRLFSTIRGDVLRFAKPVETIEGAMRLADPMVLRHLLAVVPPASGAFDQPWQSMDAYQSMRMNASRSEAARDPILLAWMHVADAWTKQDAAQASAAIVDLGRLLPETGRAFSAEYPSETRLQLESAYFKPFNLLNPSVWTGATEPAWGGFTWVWVVYLLSVILLLMGLVYGWNAARRAGMSVFVIAFVFQTMALVLRYIIADRWPNTNMFEAVTTSTWFGGCFALFMEILLRKTRARTLFAIGSAVASMIALMAASFSPVLLSPHVSNRMPVLHDVWLYIHTNVIIFSYVLIFLASVSAALYLCWRGVRWMRGDRNACQHAGAGGVGSFIVRRGGGRAPLLDSATGYGTVLDGTTMLLMELSFVLLWAGLVMGAIWADHSWGRPWGWDPKEVFALNTFLIYVILIHVRIKTLDKGMWTAALAVIGCGVMLFNWIIINYTISGLHSYA